jgi:tRNA/rRNA methyltransferase
MIKPTVAPRAAAERMREREAAGEACGVLFGPERSGLTNDEVALGDSVLAVPVNPEFSSLNLAHAVLIVAYEWWVAAGTAAPARIDHGATRPATKAELLNFFDHLEGELDEAGFLHVVEKRPVMVRNIRNLFQRAELTEQEVRTLHGIVTGLSGRRRAMREPD